MAEPDFCGFHPELMRIFGQLEQGQADLHREMGEVKKELTALARALKERELANAKSETKAGLLYWALNGGLIAGISAATHFLIKRLSGE
jgi:hypothetical protein